MIEISIVIPAYNEEKTIGRLVSEIFKIFKREEIEVIVVDDHSTDSTREIVKSLEKKFKDLRLLKKRGKRGKTTSILQGFEKARGKIISMIDADLQYPPSAIPKMAKLIKEGKADIVVGKRIYKTDFRKVLSSSFSFFSRVLLGIKSGDIQSGEKVFKRKVLDEVGIENIKSKKWGFDVEFLFRARKFGLTDFPIKFSPRISGRTKVSILYTTFDLFIVMMKLFTERIKILRS